MDSAATVPFSQAPTNLAELAASTSVLTIDTTSVAEAFRHQADGTSIVTEHNEKDCNAKDDILSLEAQLKTSDDDLQHMMSVLQRRSATIDNLVTQYQLKVKQLETKISRQAALYEDDVAHLRRRARREIKKLRLECTTQTNILENKREQQVQELTKEINKQKLMVKTESARAHNAQLESDKRGLEVQRLTEELASVKEQNRKLIETGSRKSQNIEKLEKYMTTFFQQQHEEHLREREVVGQKTHEPLEIQHGKHSQMQPHVVVADAITPGLSGTVNRVTQQPQSLWEQRVRPHFDRITRALSPKKILPKLYSNKLIDHNEFSSLSGSKQSEQDIATELLRDILLKKGDDAFWKFCATLRDVEGQHEIADLIDPQPTVHV